MSARLVVAAAAASRRAELACRDLCAGRSRPPDTRLSFSPALGRPRATLGTESGPRSFIAASDLMVGGVPGRLGLSLLPGGAAGGGGPSECAAQADEGRIAKTPAVSASVTVTVAA